MQVYGLVEEDKGDAQSTRRSSAAVGVLCKQRRV